LITSNVERPNPTYRSTDLQIYRSTDLPDNEFPIQVICRCVAAVAGSVAFK
jgi:hypothetical protein